MKRLLLAVILLGAVTSAFAQAIVIFANATNTPGWTFGDKNVKFGITAPLFDTRLVPGANVSSNYAGVDLSGLRAELAYGVGTDPTQFTLALDSITTFKGSTSSTAGSWYTKDPVTLTGFTTGSLNLCVYVWDIRADYSPLGEHAQDMLWGSSGVFSYTIPSSVPPVPWEYLMADLPQFTVGLIPEPGTFSLTVLGVTGLLVFRRKRMIG